MKNRQLPLNIIENYINELTIVNLWESDGKKINFTLSSFVARFFSNHFPSANRLSLLPLINSTKNYYDIINL